MLDKCERHKIPPKSVDEAYDLSVVRATNFPYGNMNSILFVYKNGRSLPKQSVSSEIKQQDQTWLSNVELKTTDWNSENETNPVPSLLSDIF